MKVLYVCTDFNRSGAALAMIELACNEKQNDVEPLLVFPGHGDAVDVANSLGLKTKVIRSYEWTRPLNRKENVLTRLKWLLKYLYNVISIIKISLLIRKERIDIVHNNTMWGYVGPVSAIITHTKLVWHIREMLKEQNVKIRWESFGKRLIGKADVLIAISKYVADGYSKLITHSRVELVYDGVDRDKYYLPNRRLMKGKRLNIITLGGVRPHKRQMDIVKAVENMINQRKDVFLRIVGDDTTSYAKEIQAYVKDNKLMHNIEFCGETNDVAEFYKLSDVAVTASAHEAFGRVTVEGMLAGCIVVASDSGANAELIQDKSTGFIYEVGNIEELTKVLLYIFEHKSEGSNYARNGQSHAYDAFDSKENARKIYKIYRSLV